MYLPPSTAPGSSGGGGEDDHPSALLHLRQGAWEQVESLDPVRFLLLPAAPGGGEVPEMASGSGLSNPDPAATDPERRPPALTDDDHEEIFLRVASPADLARAAAAARDSFRSIIADHAFLRRYRSIHPPLLLGFASPDGFHPALAPHPSAVVARSVASFDLPPTTRDVRDGRVLFERSRGKLLVNRERLVLDPLSRRCQLLPPITSELLASIGNISNAGTAFIRPGGIEDTSFRVIYWLQSTSRLGVFIFSSDSDCWSVSTSISWGDLGLAAVYKFISQQYTNDCFYWKSKEINTLIKLDMNSMRFHAIGLPPGHEERQIVIVESGENSVSMFSMIYEGTSVDYYTFSQNGSENSYEWHLKSTIPLPGLDAILLVCSPDEGYIFLECTPDEENARYSEFLSLDIKSFDIQRVSRRGIRFRASRASRAYPYFGYPPSMSPMRI